MLKCYKTSMYTPNAEYSLRITIRVENVGPFKKLSFQDENCVRYAINKASVSFPVHGQWYSDEEDKYIYSIRYHNEDTV